jgi:hypothetical protein
MKAMKARTVIIGGLAVLALSGCAGQGNAATTPATPTPSSGGNFLPFYVNQLQQPDQPKDDCGTSLLTPCDKGDAR